MAQVEDESDDLLWQAQVLLEHQRRRKLHAIVTIVKLCVGLVMMLTPVLLMTLLRIEILDEIGREGLICCFIPLLLPLTLVSSFVWRCPACGDMLGRGDPQFCPSCGAQLQFLDD